MLFLGTATFKRIYLKHHVFVKRIDFFQNPISVVHFLKSCVVLFIGRSSELSLILLNCSGFSKRSSLSHPFYHLGWFLYQSGCSHPFFQGLDRTDNFWQLLLIKTLINTTTYWLLSYKTLRKVYLFNYSNCSHPSFEVAVYLFLSLKWW